MLPTIVYQTSQPFKCPVCEGSGRQWTSYDIFSEPCHACNETGIVWGPPKFVNVPSVVIPEWAKVPDVDSITTTTSTSWPSDNGLPYPFSDEENGNKP